MLALLPSSWTAQSAADAEKIRDLSERTYAQEQKRRERLSSRLSFKLPPAPATIASADPAAPAPAPAPTPAAGCTHGGPCCGLTGFRCHIPGLPCGACTDAQKAAAAAAGIF
jgi:hypothetical protein